MKTLKKSLALVLAVVMALSVLGVLAVPASAYTDDDDITNVEAVDVMSAIDVFEGINGAFQPGKTLTRAEAATAIARLMLTRKVADLLPKSGGKFTDVAPDHWAGGAINYCVSMNIINGATPTTFNPEGEISDVGFLKMLLAALGYNKNGELTGNLWMVNTLAQAISLGLDDGVTGVDFATAATRDNMAQYAFNTLIYSPTAGTISVTKYEIIGISNGFTTNGGYATAIAGNPYPSFAAAATAAAALTGATYVYNTDYIINAKAVAAPDYKGSIADKTYGLSYDYYPDAFGRPDSLAWIYKGKDISSTPTADPALTYTTAVSGAKIFADLGFSKTTVVTPTHLNDGTTGGAVTVAPTDIAAASMCGGNGCLTEVYVTDRGTNTADVLIVEIDTYVAKVSNVVAATATADAYVELDVSTGYTSPGTLTLNGKFETTNFTVNDVVLYTAAFDAGEYDVQSVELAEKANLTATSVITTTPASFVAGGTSYKYSENGDGAISASDVTNKVEKVVYFDSYGYVIKVANVTSATNYAVVLNQRTNSGWTGEDTYDSRLLLADGTVVEVPVPNGTSGSSVVIGSIVTYASGTGANTGKTVLTKVGVGYAAYAAEITRSVVSFKATNAAGNGQATYTANSKTIFFVETSTPGGTVYNVYTGIAAVPTITTSVGSTVYVSASGGNTFATVVYVKTATVDPGTTAASEITYIDVQSQMDGADSRGEFSTYNAVVNGVPTTIDTEKDVFKAGETNNASSLDALLLASVDRNDKGLVTGGTLLTVAGTITDVEPDSANPCTGTVKAANGVVGLGRVATGTIAQLSYNADTAVYFVTPVGITKATNGVADIKNDGDDTVVYYTTNNVLTAVFITVNGVHGDGLYTITSDPANLTSSITTETATFTLTPDKTSAAEGETVTVTVAWSGTIAGGSCTSAGISITNGAGSPITSVTWANAGTNITTVVSTPGSTTFTFVMPAGNVTGITLTATIA